MKKAMKQKLLETKNAYIVPALLSLIVVTFAVLISNGHLFQVFFFPDPDDTGMDFFNSMVEVSTRKPYEQYHVLYPPLANLFFYVLTLFVPNAIKSEWPANHEAVKGMVGTDEDLRLTQSALLIFLTVLILSLFLMTVMIHRRTHNYLLTFCLVLSAGTLAAIERGNIVLIAFLLTFYFVEHYNDESRLKSELALLALAAAFGLKLYPCVFGLLLLKDRKFAAAGRAILYAALATVIPTFFLEGPSSLSDWLRIVFVPGGNSAADASSETSGFALPLNMILFMILGLILLIVIFVKRNGTPLIQFLLPSQILFLITFISVLIGDGASGYNLVFFLIPFLAFLEEERSLSRYNCIEFLIYLICLIPLGINEVTYLFFGLFLIGCGLRLCKSLRQA